MFYESSSTAANGIQYIFSMLYSYDPALKSIISLEGVDITKMTNFQGILGTCDVQTQGPFNNLPNGQILWLDIHTLNYSSINKKKTSVRTIRSTTMSKPTTVSAILRSTI